MGGINMCLIKIHKFPRIAFKDIVVYKYLTHLVWPVNGKEVVATPIQRISIEPGKTIIKSKKCILRGIFKKRIEAEGVHAYLIPLIIGGVNIYIYKAIIPKGSLYYMGRDTDIAASKMFITDTRI